MSNVNPSDLAERRRVVRFSQLGLARESGVSRFKIALHELGDKLLTAADSQKVELAIAKEAERLRESLAQLERSERKGTGESVRSGGSGG